MDVEPRSTGRPRGFDPERKLAEAVDLFWREGYAATSLGALTRTLDLSRSSLYACFGSKRELLMRALEFYAEALVRRLREAAQAAPGAEVAAILSALAATENPAHGCLLVNCIAELAPHDPELAAFARKKLAEVEALVAERLAGDGREERARALVALAVGALTLRKAGVDPAAVEAMLAAAEPRLA